MPKPFYRFIVSLCCFLALAGPTPAQDLPVVRIGMVMDGPWAQNASVGTLFQSEILTLLESEFDVQFPEDKILEADWTAAGTRLAVDRLLEDPEIDLVITIGLMASDYVCRLGELPKPVIAPIIVDSELQGLPMENGTSGVRNLNYLTFPAQISRDIRAFKEIVPFEKVLILFNKEIQASVPGIAPRVQNILGQTATEAQVIPVGDSVEEALALFPPDAEAVYVAPLLHLDPSEYEKLIQGLIARRLPSFSLLGSSEVELGLMATVTPNIFPRLSRRVALNIQRILLGEPPETLPVGFTVGEQLTINMATVRAIRVWPSFTVLTEAVLLHDSVRQTDRRLTMYQAMSEAIDQNLDLTAREHTVAAGAQRINQARAAWLPQIQASGTGLIIDRDRAAASLGSQTERSLTAGITGSQLIFSEPALASVTIQKRLQEQRVREQDRLRLDIIHEAVTTYLNVLRAKTFERIQKQNLKLTRSNYELAQMRAAVGQSQQSEVYRWESEIANDRKSVITANAQRNLAEIALNRLLNRPLEEFFETQEVGVNDPQLITSQEGVLRRLDNPGWFDMVRDILVDEGLRKSPELQALDAVVAVQERSLRSANRSFWSPTIALQAGLTNRFAVGGAGTGLSVPAGLSLTPPNDLNWNIGLNFSIPLFEGSARFAQRTRAQRELEALETQRESISDRIEQRIRSALHIAVASRAGIRLSQQAAEAAQKNLDLVVDAYSRGVIDILGLLDAQNVALLAQEAAANAVYDFLIDMMEVERAVGGFYLFVGPEERTDWLRRAAEQFERMDQ